jgi:serine/threonine-protein kinase
LHRSGASTIIRPVNAAAQGLRGGQKLGKYRLGRKIGEGGFSVVYRARDTIEGIDVALKIPHAMSHSDYENLLKEIRINVRLEHPNILAIRNATIADGRLVIAYPLATGTLGDRLRYRMSSETALDIFEQLLVAVAFAHSERVIHCDINPNNILLFGNTVKLADFGLARVAMKTRVLHGSGSGTVGYVAPEQAMGRPSYRSDVFSLGLVLYRLFAGVVPDWPYKPPLSNFQRVRRRLSPEMQEFVLRAIEVEERKRFPNAVKMASAYARMREPLRGR